jgi:hypothetical protein
LLARDVQIIDIDPYQVENAVSSRFGEGGPEKPPMLIVFYRDNSVVHAVHSEKGPLNSVR